MRIFLHIILCIALFTVSCQQTPITRPINDPGEIDPYPSQPDYSQGNTGNDDQYDDSWEQQALRRQAKEYPVILAVDHVRKVLDQPEMIFSKVNQALSGTFTILDSYQLDKDIRDEVMSTTGTSMLTYQDILFRKFSQADICVYLWCEVNPYDGNIGGRPITFHEARMGCRVVDTFSKQSLADITKSSGRQHFNSGSEDDKQRRAVEMILPQLASELQQTLEGRIGDIIKRSFRIRGVIEKPDELRTFQTVLRTLEDDGLFRIKRVISEAAHFEYEIANTTESVSAIAELLKDNAEVEGTMITVRVSERKNTKLIQISLADEKEDF